MHLRRVVCERQNKPGWYSAHIFQQRESKMNPLKTFTFSIVGASLIAATSQAGLVAQYNMEQGTSPLVDQVGGQTAVQVGSGHVCNQTGSAGFGNAVGLTDNVSGNGARQLSAADRAELDFANNFTVAAFIYFDSSITKTSGSNLPRNRIIGDEEPWDGDGWAFAYDHGVVNKSWWMATPVPSR